jgi:catechol 2,3-dioxygenase-like lactoylglutathione lyase family enzyme
MRARPRVTATSPCLVVSDLQASLEFYCDKLGFEDPSVWGEPPCFAMLNRDDFDLMLSLATENARVRPNGPDGVWDVYIRVEDARAEAATLIELGVRLDREPSATEYEMTEIEVVDPDGYRICFGSIGIEST